MGTYLKFIQEDETKVKATDETLATFKDEDGDSIMGLWTQADVDIEQDKLNNGGHGVPEYMEIGEGQVKLSGTSEENLEVIANALSVIVKEHNTTISEMPTNALDYFSAEQVELFYSLEKLAEENKIADAEHTSYLNARSAALAKKQEELNGGAMYVKSWGNGGFWLIFGSVDTPKFLKYEFEVDESIHSDIYKDKKGDSYLLIPLMGFGPKGVEKVYDALSYAWDNLGLRTQPNTILAQVYGVIPKDMKFGRVTLNQLGYTPQY